MNLKKTREDLIYGQNCDTNNAYEEILFNKQYHNKTGGRQFIHFTQSFSPGDEITPEMANEIGKKLLEEHEAFKGFKIVMTTHVDRDHLHNHFVIDTVNSETGKKWKQSRQQLAELKDISDELCEQYGLLVIPGKKEGYKSDAEYYGAKEERSWKKELALAASHARFASCSQEEFVENMEKLGYKVDWDFKESDEEQHIQAVLNVCKSKADDKAEFERNLNYYGINLKWKINAKVIDQEGESIDKVFESKEELDEYIESMDENLEIEWTDDIEFTRDGEIYTPSHFVKSSRFNGRTLRETFEINSQNEIDKTLPDEMKIGNLGNSDELKRLFLSVNACKQHSVDKNDFISKMNKLGYKLEWSEKRKYITFITPKGKKIRNRMLYPPENYTKDTLEEVFSLNKKMKQIIDENIPSDQEMDVDESYEKFLNLVKKQGSKLNLEYDEKKKRVSLSIPFKNKDGEEEYKKCFFYEENIKQMLQNEGKIEMPSEEEIFKSLNMKTIMFETPDGKKCSNKQLYPSKKYTKENLNETFEINKKRADMWRERQKFQLLLSALKMMSQDENDKSNNRFPLSKLEGQDLKEYWLEQAKGEGLDWEK